MYRVTLKLTRPNTTVFWDDPTSDADVYEVLYQAAARNISVDQRFSEDRLSMSIIWISPSQEVWDEFSSQYLRKDGEFDDAWYKSNDIQFEIIKENIND